MAVRLLADTAHTAQYNTLYIATLSGLETEVLPHAVPFRRYVLPAHALTLVSELAGTEPGTAASPLQTHLADELAHAVVGFLDYATSKPDYLMDEIVLL